MKKLFIFACVALLGLCASAQQKGDMAAGLNLGVAPCLESGASVTNFGIGAKFQYNVTNPIRLEAAFDYGFKNKGIDVMTVGVNGHYIFNLGSKFSIYPLIGIGYAHLGASNVNASDVDWDDLDFDDFMTGYMNDYDVDSDVEETTESSSANKFYFNVGAGAEYALNSKISLGLEIKYQYIKDFSRLPISIGATYKF